MNPDAAGAYLERSTGGWNWEPVCTVPYSVRENVLQIAVPREALGLTGKSVHFNFKWSDNMQPLDGVEGDIMDFYLSGDVAPGGRFAFRFTDRRSDGFLFCFQSFSFCCIGGLCGGNPDSCGGDSFQYQKETGKNMTLKMIERDFSICKIRNIAQVDFTDEFCFVGKTDQELSLVCTSDCVPKDVLECEHGWKAFRIEGVLDFSLIGILSKISELLAKNKIGIFVVSTYNTDYILTKKEQYKFAADVLKCGGYSVVSY